jgi:predicted alpha/beta hydrolase family esterase
MEKIYKFLLTKIIGSYINILSYIAPKKAFKLAYTFFSNPRIGKLKAENLPQFLQDSHQETLQHKEHTIQTYIWKGDTTTILLAHGWESNTARWEKLLPNLIQTGHTIVAVDAPAHGLSSGKEFNVPLYASFLEVVIRKHQPKHIIGHSMGGITATYYQYLYSNHHLEKMVLLGSPSDFSIILENYLKLLSLNHNIRKAFHNYTLERFQIDIDNFSGKEFLKTTQLKGIIIHDTEDTVVRIAEAQKLASTWKSSELITTSGFGHSLRDESINEKIIDFLLEA